MNRPDLDAHREVVDEQLVDRCIITSDVQGARDDTLDPTTLALAEPVNDSILVYEGACLVTTRRTQNRPSEQGGGGSYETQWRARLPFGVEGVHRGQTLTVTECEEDPALEGRTFTVDNEPSGRSSLLVALLVVEPGPSR